MTPDADIPQVGLGSCPCRGQATPGEAAFYCGKYDKCRPCRPGRRMHLLPSVIFHEAQLVKFLIVNAVWNTCHGIPTCLSKAMKISPARDTTPSFLLNPEHQLHRGLQNIFFLLLESTDLHGITLLSKHACASSWLLFALLPPRRTVSPGGAIF